MKINSASFFNHVSYTAESRTALTPSWLTQPSRCPEDPWTGAGLYRRTLIAQSEAHRAPCFQLNTWQLQALVDWPAASGPRMPSPLSCHPAQRRKQLIWPGELYKKKKKNPLNVIFTCVTYRALCEIKQGGDKIIIVTAVVGGGWTTGGGSSCSSLWLLLGLSLLICWWLTSVWSQSTVLHNFWPSRILHLRLLCLVLPKAS